MQKESRFTRNILSNSGYFLILDYCTLKGSPVFDDIINVSYFYHLFTLFVAQVFYKL